MGRVNKSGGDKLFYTASETAALLSVSTKSVYRLIDRGLLASSSALRTKLIPRASIEAFLASALNVRTPRATPSGAPDCHGVGRAPTPPQETRAVKSPEEASLEPSPEALLAAARRQL